MASKKFSIQDLDKPSYEKIFNFLPQNQVPNVALVCKKWRDYIDKFYEFAWTLDCGNNQVFQPFTKRCRKLIIRKLNLPTMGEDFQFMIYPNYLKEVLVLRPIALEYLEHLVLSSQKLEKIKFGSESHVQTALGLAKTPSFANITNLKELVYEGEGESLIPISTLLECNFPKLIRFTLDLSSQENIELPEAVIWKFFQIHQKTLNHFTLEYYDSLSEFNFTQDLSTQVPGFVKLELGTKWSPFWAQILAQQSNLEELYLKAQNKEYDERLVIPWTDIQTPITNSAETLKSVKIEDLSLVVEGQTQALELRIFKPCLKLTKLCLAASPEKLTEELLIIGNELPESLLELNLLEVTMLSSDLVVALGSLKNLKALKLNNIGATKNFGVNYSVLYSISTLEKLRIAQFNISDPIEEQKLRISIELLGDVFAGSETSLDLLNYAYRKLSVLKECCIIKNYK